MKKISTILVLFSIIITLQSTIKKVDSSSNPPNGYSGSTGVYCNSCHGSFSLNSGGGSISVNGLPGYTYTPGQTYNFTLTISHGAADRKKWGFLISAINSGNNIGTFSSTNTNAQVNSSELGHNSAVTTTSQSSYTYSNLSWTAPSTPNLPITFYFAGNAANSNGSTNGDYIYSSSQIIALPIDLYSFSCTSNKQDVIINWQTNNEINSDYFEVEKSDDGQIFYSIAKITASGYSSVLKSYQYIDTKPSYFEKPIFYRLKLVDKDKSFKYSKIINVKLKALNTVVKKVFPSINYAGGNLKAEVVSDENMDINILVLDAGGKILQLNRSSITSGSNNLNILLPNTLQKGMAFIKFVGNDLSQTISIVIQ
jgi:hypothetical protein